jgi:hypothetical protein
MKIKTNIRAGQGSSGADTSSSTSNKGGAKGGGSATDTVPVYTRCAGY